jgi:pimeloyl-ACP methyl ester carboxylesterase
VRSLALLTPFLAPTPRLLAVADAWARAASEAKPDTLARLLAPWLFSDATLGDEGRRERMLRGLAPMLARTPATALARTVEGLRAWRGAEREVLARLRVPVVVVVGASDVLTPDGEAVAEAIPGAALARVAGAGHAVAVEAPEAVNAALVAHLARG